MWGPALCEQSCDPEKKGEGEKGGRELVPEIEIVVNAVVQMLYARKQFSLASSM